MLARLVLFVLGQYAWGQAARDSLYSLIPAKELPYFGSALFSLGMGYAGATVVNYCIGLLRGDPQRSVIRWIVAGYDNGLLTFLHDATMDQVPVSITLANRKCYVGYVWKLPNNSHQDRYVSLVLLLSGYRKEETLEMVVSTNYTDKITDGEERYFEIMFGIDQVLSANRFDLDVYNREFREKLVEPS